MGTKHVIIRNTQRRIALVCSNARTLSAYLFPAPLHCPAPAPRSRTCTCTFRSLFLSFPLSSFLPTQNFSRCRQNFTRPPVTLPPNCGLKQDHVALTHQLQHQQSTPNHHKFINQKRPSLISRSQLSIDTKFVYYFRSWCTKVFSLHARVVVFANAPVGAGRLLHCTHLMSRATGRHTRPKKLNPKQNVQIFREEQVEIVEYDSAHATIETGVEKNEESVSFALCSIPLSCGQSNRRIR